jgi:hypothetical protein
VASYRAKVSLQIGDTGVGTAATTLQDTDATVIFDSTKTLLARNSQQTAWFLTLGTKIGSGDAASGVRGCVLVLGAATTFRGTIKLYGCTIRQTAGALTWAPGANNTGEAINTLFQSSSSGTSPFSFGTAGAAEIDNLYNCDFSHTTAVQMAANLNSRSAERITLACAAPTALVSTGAVGLEVKDAAMFGTPTQSDLRWTSSSSGWKLIRPRFTGNAPKFSSSSAVAPDLSGATIEYWLWGVKVVDGDGDGIASIPVTLTDVLGNVQVNETTDANGEVSFGSELTTNAIAVADHYISGGVYTLRQRSPFLLEVNTGGSASSDWPSRSLYFDWVGSEAVTTSTGSFEDMYDVIPLQSIGGNPTNWTECELP